MRYQFLSLGVREGNLVIFEDMKLQIWKYGKCDPEILNFWLLKRGEWAIYEHVFKSPDPMSRALNKAYVKYGRDAWFFTMGASIENLSGRMVWIVSIFFKERITTDERW